MKLLRQIKQKIIFFTFAREGLTSGQRLQKQIKYLSYNFFYNLLPEYQPASLRKAMQELIQSGEMDQIVRNRRVFLRLTTMGERRIKLFFPNFFYQQIKSEGWVIGIVKKSKEARQIRQELLKKGFVSLTRGIYFQAAKLDFIKSLEELAGKVFFIFTRKLEFTDEKQLVGRRWNLNQFYQKDQNFIKQAKKVLNRVAGKNNLTIKDKKLISALSSQFFIIIKNTIRLPKNLLPDDWPLPEAAKIFSQILRKVE